MDLEQLYNSFKETFSEKTSRDLTDHTLIVDGTNLFIRSFAAIPTISENGEHVGGLYGTLRSLSHVLRMFTPTRCIMVFDGVGGSLRRRKLYPEYKNNRKNKLSLNRNVEFGSIEEEQRSLKLQMERLSEYLEKLPVTVLSMDLIEADDVISYICSSGLGGKKVTILSTDRDYLQLVNDTISVYRPIEKRLYTKENFKEYYGFSADNFLLYKILLGDKSDNISKVPGVGKKTLLKYFPEITTEHLTSDDLIKIARERIESGAKQKIYQTVVEHSDLISRNFQLMQLHDVDISGTYKSAIRKILNDNVETEIQEYEILKMLAEDKLNFLMRSEFDVDMFLFPFKTLAQYVKK